MADVHCLLDNEPWSGASSSFTLKDPHNGKDLYKVHSVQRQDCEHVVQSAAAAAELWRETSALERRRIFNKALHLLEERKEDFIKISTTETTANILWGNVDWHLTWDIISETAALATALRGEMPPVEHGSYAYVDRIPYGVVFGIPPWNAPLTLGTRAFANAIMAGNAVILKSSEYSPGVHAFAAKLFHDAGLPAGVLNVIHVATPDAPSVCETIIAHPAVRKLNFTGSTGVGSKLAELCGRHLIPCVMELGGKSPVIILPDADLKAAVSAIMFGGFMNSGQICMSSDIILAHESVADEVLKLLAARLEGRAAASHLDAPNGYRGLFTEASATRLSGIIADALNKGGKLAIGKPDPVQGNIVQPTVIEATDSSMRIYHEEMFGPVMSLRRFSTTEEAIKLANASEYGLAASVYGADEKECWAVARRIDAGQVHINGPTVHDEQTVPHGGLKKSGFGRFNGIEGLKEFSVTKTITVNVPHDKYPS